MISVVFFGTSEFAAAILSAMLKSGLFEVKLAVTQPDRPAGRHMEINQPAVKLLAEKYSIPVVQPERLKELALPDDIYDINLVAEYGLLIPPNVIHKPRFGTLNFHPSLLPLYRGASPLQSALLNGEKETGVTLMLIDEKLDHGPIVAQKKLTIEADDTYPLLLKKAAETAAAIAEEFIPAFMDKKIIPAPQDDSRATFCSTLTRADGQADFHQPAAVLYNRFRGLTPWPGLWTLWNGRRLKFLKIRPINQNGNPGRTRFEKGRLFIGCAEGSIEILELQPEGKKPMTADEFIRGYKNFEGVQL